ncbi:MAG: hypothetical protein NVS3B21_03070 [Acidimicrobiales bacterium]
MTVAYRCVERLTCNWAEAIVAVSEKEATTGRAVLGPTGRQRLRLIPNGVDLLRFHPEGDVAPRSSAPLLVSVGRLAQQKGQDVAIRALALVADPNTRLRLVGDGTDAQRAKLSALAVELGVGSRVEIEGHRDDPAPHLRAADVVVCASRWEGQSLALLEALACGCAVVSTAVAGTEILDCGAGVTTPVDDPRALAVAISTLLADPGLRAQLRRCGRTRCEQVGDLRVTLRRNLALWEELVARP